MIMPNDPPNTRLPYSKSKPLATYRSPLRSITYIRPSYMISLQLRTFTIHWTNLQHINYISMMTRYCTRRYISRPPHPRRTKRSSLRHNPFHCIRSIFLLRIFLGLLPLQPSPYPRTRGLLTSSRYYPSKSTRGSTSKYISSFSLRSVYHLSSP